MKQEYELISMLSIIDCNLGRFVGGRKHLPLVLNAISYGTIIIELNTEWIHLQFWWTHFNPMQEFTLIDIIMVWRVRGSLTSVSKTVFHPSPSSSIPSNLHIEVLMFSRTSEIFASEQLSHVAWIRIDRCLLRSVFTKHSHSAEAASSQRLWASSRFTKNSHVIFC